LGGPVALILCKEMADFRSCSLSISTLAPDLDWSTRTQASLSRTHTTSASAQMHLQEPTAERRPVRHQARHRYQTPTHPSQAVALLLARLGTIWWSVQPLVIYITRQDKDGKITLRARTGPHRQQAFQPTTATWLA